MQYSAPTALKHTGVASFFSVRYVPNKQVCCSVILSLSTLDFIPLSQEEVGCPLRWRLPLETPTAAPQEGLQQKCKGKVSAPSGTITGMDPFSLEMVGRDV